MLKKVLKWIIKPINFLGEISTQDDINHINIEENEQYRLKKMNIKDNSMITFSKSHKEQTVTNLSKLSEVRI